MRTTSLSLLIACTATSMASPFSGSVNNNPQRTDFVELFREPVSKNLNDHLVFLGYPNGTETNNSERTKFEKRSCSATSAPTCSSHNSARNDICESLVTELNGDATVAVSSSPRQICYEGGAAETNKYCCVSWGSPVSPLTKGDLSGYATTMASTCTQNGVSGKFGSVPVGSSQKCIEVCLSDRGTHC